MKVTTTLSRPRHARAVPPGTPSLMWERTMGEGYAWLCAVCDGHGSWRLLRRGDAVVSWACHEHLARVGMGLQRGHEETELVVKINTNHPQLSEPYVD